ncbi:MAG: MCE family protein, partial [Mycobacterium sp.]
MTRRTIRVAITVTLVLVLVSGLSLTKWPAAQRRTHVVAYFESSNGIFVGDDVVILGVKVGQIDKIEPQPQRAKISFWLSNKYTVPADVDAVILSPKLITSRAIQLTPVYTGGPTMHDGAVITQDRTAVPVEFDDLREQLEKMSKSLAPNTPGGVSSFGEFIDTTAANLRGQGTQMRRTLIELSQAVSAVGDHSGDVFGTMKHLSTLVSALRDSADLMRELNTNLAEVTGLLADDPDAIGRAVTDLNTAVADVTAFIADNRDALGTTTDTLASISKTLVGSIDDIKQTLHVLPTVVQNFVNIYDPAHGAITGILGLNFANPITFLCGAIEAASRLNNAESAKLCVQYLAPIVKNRQYNFLPFGMNPIVNAKARPNELTYSEDSLRPDYRPPAVPDAAPQAQAPAQPASSDPG